MVTSIKPPNSSKTSIFGGVFANAYPEADNVVGDAGDEFLPIKDISQMKYFVVSRDPAALAIMNLGDREKKHPVVLLQDGTLLVIANPSALEQTLIPALKSRLCALKGIDSSSREIRVERAVFRSWLEQRWSAGGRRVQSIKNDDCETILRTAIDLGATDIHIDVVSRVCTVKYRANGVLCYPTVFNGEVGQAIIAAFWETYAESGIKGDVAKDGRFSRVVGRVEYLFRLSFGASPALDIASLAIRVRNMRDIPKVAQLGYSERQKALITECQGRAGMVLICGAVNSGKSTLQTAWMNALPVDQFNLEISDQVEVLLPNFIQLQKPSGGRDWVQEQIEKLYILATRHDINFIAVNEVRDRATARLMEDLMQQGTPGISSIHAKGWPEAINRLLGNEMGVRPETLFGEGFFNAFAYQTLGRVLCDCCKLGAHKDDFWTEYFLNRLGGPLAFRNPEGCDACNNTGIKGLTAVAEFLPIRKSNRALLRDTTNITAMYQWMHENDVPTIFEHALEKIKAQQLDPLMVQRTLGDFDETNIFDAFRSR